MKIFIGTVEVASFTATYAKGFRALGHETFSMVQERSRFYPDACYDLALDSPGRSKVQRDFLRLRYFRSLARACDVFVFLFSETLLPNQWDLPILRAMGKKIVSVFVGSDIRYGPAVEQEMKQLGYAEEMQPFLDYFKSLPVLYARQKRKVEMAERYSDVVLSQPGYGQLQTRPYMRVNIPLDLSAFRFHIPNREVPVVLHAPSNSAIKGTQYILEVFEQLKREGVSFEYQLIQNTPNHQVRAMLAEADIVVDELFADTVGVLSTEAMASGNAVLVHYPAEFARVPPGCPAVNITKDTLKDRLREVIQNQGLRVSLAQAGRPYVEKNNDHVQIARQVLSYLQPGGIQAYDFAPQFYRQVKAPFSVQLVESLYLWRSRWLSLVKH